MRKWHGVPAGFRWVLACEHFDRISPYGALRYSGVAAAAFRTLACPKHLVRQSFLSQ